ncbi:hypothetical protein, partial [Endozoicomonas sp. SESOKO2]|uniref:hypothetical protein n=1 Tax=Endozoicomonas sp. SESOKO2 TaxID=2828743 RepID=UPI0021477588
MKSLKPEAESLATLFVDSVLEDSLPKRGELISRLERIGYSFGSDDPSYALGFWFGDAEKFPEYKEMVEKHAKQEVKINKSFSGFRWLYLMGEELRDLGKEMPNQVNKELYEKLFKRNIAITSSFYSAGAKGKVYVFAEGGVRYDNFFWNSELPLLRGLQKKGRVSDIRVVDHVVNNPSTDQPLGHSLINGVKMKARYGSLNAELKSRLPTGRVYKDNDFVDVPVKADLVDRLLRKKIPFYLLRSELNLMVVKKADGFRVSPWAEGGTEKIIRVDDPDDPKKIKAVQDFILANYQRFDQLPDQIELAGNKIFAIDGNDRTSVALKTQDGRWQYIKQPDGLYSFGVRINNKETSDVVLFNSGQTPDALLKAAEAASCVPDRPLSCDKGCL